MTHTLTRVPGSPRQPPGGGVSLLVVRGAAEAIALCRRAFGAAETLRINRPDGRVGQADLRIGDALVMLADEFPEMGHRGPLALAGNSGVDAPLRR